MSLGGVAFALVLSLLAFLVHLQLVSVPVEGAASYVPKPMVEMVTGWETVDYMDREMSSNLPHQSVHGHDLPERIGVNLVKATQEHSKAAVQAHEVARTGHPWWWQMQL